MNDIEAWKLLTEWAKLIGAVAVFGIGLYQYAQAQKWKRREFISSQVKEFEADKKIQLSMTMLDWSDPPAGALTSSLLRMTGSFCSYLGNGIRSISILRFRVVL